jgi:hypothetical protein
MAFNQRQREALYTDSFRTSLGAGAQAAGEGVRIDPCAKDDIKRKTPRERGAMTGIS